MMFAQEHRSSLVSRASLAPSVHNTQPVRWHFSGDGAIWLLTDPARWLSAGDPHRRDLRVSAGAAIEATRLAASEKGLTLAAVEYEEALGASPVAGLDVSARLVFRPNGMADPLASQMPARSTFRGRFLTARKDQCATLSQMLSEDPSVTLVDEPVEIARLADLNDRASLTFFRDPAFRRELLAWMRLSPRHRGWSRDGLNAKALGMSRIEAFGAGIVLSDPVFPMLDRIGLAAGLTGEAAKTRRATAIALFHRPVDEDPVETGRWFLDLLLKITAAGFSAWPMAVVADDPDTAADVSQRHLIPNDRRLINAFRLGIAGKAAAPRARLPVCELIV